MAEYKKPSLRKEPQDETENRMSMSGPSMRPMPKPKPAPTREEFKAQERAAARSRQLTQQLLNTQHARQHWINKPRKMRRIESTLAKDRDLRRALFTGAKGGAVAFAGLPPQTQLRIIKTVSQQNKQIAKNIATAMAANNAARSLAPDPTNPFNQYNQANPNNIANKQQAIQNSIGIEEANLMTQETEAENNHTLLLTGTDQNDDAAFYSQNFETYPTPSPEPGPTNQQADDPEIKEGEKALEHAGEEKALTSYMEGDKKGMAAGFKGEAVKEVGKEAAVHVGMAAAKLLLTGV